MIGFLDFPQCVLPVSREKRIYNWDFGLLEVSWQVLGSPEGLLAAPGLALEGFSWISLDFHGFPWFSLDFHGFLGGQAPGLAGGKLSLWVLLSTYLQCTY